MEESNTSGTTIIDSRSSISVKKNAKGIHQWEVKIYKDKENNMDDVYSEIVKLEGQLQAKYG